MLIRRNKPVNVGIINSTGSHRIKVLFSPVLFLISWWYRSSFLFFFITVGSPLLNPWIFYSMLWCVLYARKKCIPNTQNIRFFTNFNLELLCQKNSKQLFHFFFLSCVCVSRPNILYYICWTLILTITYICTYACIIVNTMHSVTHVQTLLQEL